MIQLNNLSLSFGRQAIFDDVSCSISPQQKIGLVGRNGSGKTTLLNAIVGHQHLDDGTIRMSDSFNCAFMPQDVVLVSDKTILHEVLAAFQNLSRILDEYVQLEPYIANNNADNKMLEQYASIHHQLYELDYESKRTQAEQMLVGLGFKENQFEYPVSSLSVGWKMRLVLAKLLLQRADFYLFDEPTNHLDLFAKEWFVEFLRTAPFGFILVSHDEYFLDAVCESICEISRGKLVIYQGNYQSYLIQKGAGTALLEKKYEEQQKFIKKQKETIERFRAKATKASMVQSMIKSLKKVEKIELEQKQKTVGFSLPDVQRAGQVVLDVKDLGFSFESKKIFENVNFQILRGHKIAIIAPNGMGKSTLLNVIMGRYDQEGGTISLGHNVKPVLFKQDQNQSLNPDNTILEEVELVCEKVEARARARNLLGAFLFSGDNVYKKIDVLSGGEKNRVAMVKVLLQDANFLILDEPTNHLDIVSKNILCGMLSVFKGTILFVSHDRTFLNGLATNILELTPTNMYSYSGNYDAYLYHKKNLPGVQSGTQREKELRSKSSKTPNKNALKKTNELHKQIQKIEQTIKLLEKKRASVTEQFATLSYDMQGYEQAIITLGENEDELKKQHALWEELMIQLEEHK